MSKERVGDVPELRLRVLSRIRDGASVAPRALAVSGAAALLVALCLQPAPFGFLHALAAAGALLLLVSVHLVLCGPSERNDATAQSGIGGELGERIERRLEQLQDMHWELSENEARYRAVLDAQEDMIFRRDAEGRLTFVNRAFARMFGLDADAMLGSRFTPQVLLYDSDAEAAAAANGSRRPAQLVATSVGPRWISWEEQRVSAGDTGEEVQCVGRDVTEARRSALALKEARDQAEEANRAKSRFLAAMSHEIRTPMNGIMGMASLLGETALSSEQETYVRAIDQSAHNLRNLIDEILDFSKIEAGKLVLKDEAFSLLAVVQSVAELLSPSAEEKDLEMAWEVAPDCRDLFRGDETRVRQILLNLVSNAVKFTDRGGVIVRVERGASATEHNQRVRVSISVEDTGIGLSEGDKERVFAEFEQADDAMSRQRGGTGLGLAICRRLARAMNGAISLQSELDKGSKFVVEIELEPEVGALDAAVVDPDAARRLNVLLVSERSLERHSLARVLSGYGISAYEATPDVAAREIERVADAGRPFNRLVVESDANNVTAGELLTLARSVGKFAGPVEGLVLVSALARGTLAAFHAHGFGGYLVRPVRPACLLERLGVLSFDEKKTNDAATSASARHETAAEPASRQCRVLLAEDNPINALLARRIAEKLGCSVSVAVNGEEAVQAVRRALDGTDPGIALILMDVRMPVLDGFEATRMIRDMYGDGSLVQKRPPIIAMTANAFAEDREQCLAAGMDDYLAKPFDVPMLREKIERWIGSDTSLTDRGRPAA